MNKTHKAIAGIIKRFIEVAKAEKDLKLLAVLRAQAIEFAEHFEREDKCQSCGISKEKHYITTYCKKHIADFNPKQFKKLCGVQ